MVKFHIIFILLMAEIRLQKPVEVGSFSYFLPEFIQPVAVGSFSYYLPGFISTSQVVQDF